MKNIIINGVLSLILFLSIVFIVEGKEKLGILLIIYYFYLLKKSYQVSKLFNLFLGK